jgi:GcrA cell cycle regulator
VVNRIRKITHYLGSARMRANEPTWTDERIALLKSRFEAGLSCREIAADIGVSRNAVIGKLSRLNLTREKTCDEPSLPRKNGPKGRRGKTAPRLQHQMLRAIYARPQQLAEEPIHDGRQCSLFDLSEERCRWPINTPGDEDFCFCGNRPVDGLPYCAGHSRLAYRLNSYQRVARK